MEVCVTDWLGVLTGGMLCGALLVGAMVLPRRSSALPLVASACSFGLAVWSAGAVANRYQTAQALAASAFFLLAGGVVGYAIAAALIPALANIRRIRVPVGSASGPDRAVLLFACTDPERYDPRAVAAMGAELAHDGAIDMPLLTTPLVYLAERARYRSLGGISPGPGLARSLRDAVRRSLPGIPIELAWAYARPTLAETAARLSATGAQQIAVVVLGVADSPPVERALAALGLDDLLPARSAVGMTSSLWLDRELARNLADRVIALADEATPGTTGIVLVCAGQPPVFGADRPGAAADDTYFTQRVRMSLLDGGIDEHLVRVAWLEWQQPDVTEEARHLAALGCNHILVVPATIALPSVSVELDLRHSIREARLPADVMATILPAWGDDPAFVDTVVRCALETLDTP